MKKKMLISVSNNYLYDRRMQRIADELSKDFDITIFAVKTKLNTASKVSFPYHVHHVSLPFKKGVLFYFFLNVRLFLFLLFKRYDVVYSVDLDTIGACSLSKIFSNYKLVFDAHEYFTEVPELEGKMMKKKIWTKIGQFGTKRSDLCFTVNEPLSQILGKKYQTDFHVLRNMPFSLKNEALDITEKERIILYQGAVNKGRGIEEAIQAMKQLPDYKLMIIGEGDLYERLSNHVMEDNIHNVVFTGYVTPDQLNNYTKRAHIGLNLIASYSLNYYYSLANKFFDYVQNQVPSINMNYPVYAKLNAQHQVSVLIESLEVEQLVNAVYRLNNPEFYSKLKEQCFQASQVWTWENERNKLSLVKDLLD